MSARTLLFPSHQKLHATIVNFHGWEMPLHYGSQLEEHNFVRENVGMFDVSHMMIIDVLGSGGRAFLRKLLANDVDSLGKINKALYSCMCNEYGGIIDDLIIYQRDIDNYRLVLNSATRERDLAWLRDKSQGFAIGLQERNDLGIIAVQGPKTLEVLLTILKEQAKHKILNLKSFECVDIEDYFFARTGYTGEDGFEIMLPLNKIEDFWSLLLTKEVKPCGLGARDTLRLEAGMLLYGQDMDESTTPLESGLAWTIKWEPRDRDFIGMSALLAQKDLGIPRKLVGLVLENSDGIMRNGYKLKSLNEAEKLEGIITSGTYSPTLKRSIALARLPSDFAGEKILVDMRKKFCEARVTAPRFIKKGNILV